MSESFAITPEDIDAAAGRIAGHVLRTPLVPAPRWLLALLHTWQTMREWNMTEVLVLGTAVSLVKLGQLATLIVGPGLISLMAFMALRLAALRWLTPLQAWAMLPEDAAARARRDGA